MMKARNFVHVIAVLITCAFSSLFGQPVQTTPHVNGKALDSLTIKSPKWWAEVQHLIRDRNNLVSRLETAKHVLSRSAVWQEENTRDNETRSALLMLAEEVAIVLEPELAMRPNYRLIADSQDYRNKLIAALNASSAPSRALALKALNDAVQNDNAFSIPQPAISGKVRITLPDTVSASESIPPARLVSPPSDAATPLPEKGSSVRPLWLTAGALVLAALAWLAWRKGRRI